MSTENNQSYAEKNEERVKKVIDKVEDTLADNEENKQHLSEKSAK